MEGKKVAAVLSAVGALGALGYAFYSSSSKAEAGGDNNGDVTLTIYDEWGNPVPRRRGPVGFGPVMAGARVDLVPGNYTASASIKNTSTKAGVPVAVTLNIEVSCTISGMMTPMDQDESFTAGQTRVFSVPFIVTAGMAGLSGTMSLTAKSPAGAVLGTDVLTVNVLVASASIVDTLVTGDILEGDQFEVGVQVQNGAMPQTITIEAAAVGLTVPAAASRAYAADEMASFGLTFTAPIGSAGSKTIQITIKSGSTVLDTIDVPVVIELPATLINSFILGSMQKDGQSGSMIDLKDGDSWWAQCQIKHQYAGGNFTAYVEILVDDQAWRSYKDFTLPDVAVLTTYNFYTQNQDLFNSGSLAYKAIAPVRLTLIYRGDGADWTQNQVIGTPVIYPNAVRVVEPDFAPYISGVELCSPYSQQAGTPVTDGMSGVLGNSFGLRVKLTLNALTAPSSTTFNPVMTIHRPDGTSKNVTRYSGGSSGSSTTGIYTVFGDCYSTPLDLFDQWGTYTINWVLTYLGVTYNGSFTVNVAEPPIIYGAEVTIT